MPYRTLARLPLLCPNFGLTPIILLYCSSSTSPGTAGTDLSTAVARQQNGSDPCPGWGGRRRRRSGSDRGYDAARRRAASYPTVHLATMQGPSPSDEQNHPGERRCRRARRQAALRQARSGKSHGAAPVIAREAPPRCIKSRVLPRRIDPRRRRRDAARFTKAFESEWRAGRGPSNSLKITRKLQQIRSSGLVPARPVG